VYHKHTMFFLPLSMKGMNGRSQQQANPAHLSDQIMGGPATSKSCPFIRSNNNNNKNKSLSYLLFFLFFIFLFFYFLNPFHF